MRYAISLLFAAALAAPAQIVSFGAKGGVPLTIAPFDQFGISRFGSQIQSSRWTLGPTVELHLKAGFSIEVDVLYREYRAASSDLFRFGLGEDVFPTMHSQQEHVTVWDIPFLLKYRFGEANTRPFFNIGISLTHESRDRSIAVSCLGPGDSCYPPESFIPPPRSDQFFRFQDSRTRPGGVLGAGVEFRRGRIKFAPEIRYTRLTRPGGNQVAVLFGIMF